MGYGHSCCFPESKESRLNNKFLISSSFARYFSMNVDKHWSVGDAVELVMHWSVGDAGLTVETLLRTCISLTKY